MVPTSIIYRGLFCVFLYVASVVSVFAPTASAQSLEKATADLLEAMYQSHAVMTNSGLPGMIDNPGMAYAFFTPEAVQLLPALRQQVHPLTGENSAKVASWQITPDSNPDPNAATHLVLVQGESKLKMISFDLVIQDTGPRIANIGRIMPDGTYLWRLKSDGVDQQTAPSTDMSSSDNLEAPTVESATDMAAATDDLVPEADMAQSDSDVQEMTDVSSDMADMTAPNVLDEPILVTFDGDGLPEMFTIRSEDPNAYIVENGALTMIADGRYIDFGHEQAKNLITIEAVEPEADYRMSVDFRMEPNTGFEKISLGFRTAQDDFLVAEGALVKNGCGYSIQLVMKNVRQLREEEREHVTRFEHDLLEDNWTEGYCGEVGRAQADQFVRALKEGAKIIFEKRGFYYFGTFEIVLNGQLYSYTSRAMTRFSPMNNATFMASNNHDTDGQIVVQVDQFELELQ